MKRMFTQKEINALISNAITEALENVSAKLYVHKLTLNYIDEEEAPCTIECSITSSRKEEYTLVTNLPSNLISGALAIETTDDRIICSLFYSSDTFYVIDHEGVTLGAVDSIANDEVINL